jgi:hypothetical protein
MHKLSDDEHGLSLQVGYWHWESDVQLYRAWAEPTSEAATRTTRAVRDAVRLLRPGVLFTLICRHTKQRL